MSEPDFYYINNFIRKQLAAATPKLNAQTKDAVLHYLNHAEYEMAFEGMFIDIMKLQEKPAIDFKECMAVAKLLKLNQETFFEMNFWEKFEMYIQNSVEPL